MKPPTWFLISCRRSLRPAAVRVGLALYETGSPTVDAAGNRVIHSQVSLTHLQQLTHLGRHAILDGLEQLEDCAGLVRHHPLGRRAAMGYTLPETRPTGANFTPVKTPEATYGAQRSGANFTPPLEEEEGISIDLQNIPSSTGGSGGGNKNAPAGAQQALLQALVALGADDPQLFLEQFPQELIQAWVDWAQSQPQGKLRNPAGFIYRKLQKGLPPAVKPVYDPKKGADPRDFTRGKYGKLIKY